jgi:hypothetical protein
VTPVFVVLAALVVAGAIAAVAANSPRVAILGLLVVLLYSAFVADPLPGPRGLAARLAGASLGVFLIWIALRRAPQTMPASETGWYGSTAIAVSAGIVGWLAAGTLGASLAGDPSGPGLGAIAKALIAGSPVPQAAIAAAFALAALGIPQLLLSRDTLRLGVSLMLLLASAGLVGNALLGPLTDVQELGAALLVAFAGMGVAAVILASVRRGGDLVMRDSLRPDAAIRHRAPDNAHRDAAE